MAISFPTSLDNFTNPSSGNTLDSPSHSLQHSDINDAVEAMQRKVGVGSAVAGSASAGQVLTISAAGTSTWSTPDAAGLIPIVPSSIAVATGSGSVNSVGQVTFTGATSISLNNVFSTTYKRYRILLDFVGSANNDCAFRLRASGTDATGSNYGIQGLYSDSTTTASVRTATTYWYVNEIRVAGRYIHEYELSNPGAASQTYGFARSTSIVTADTTQVFQTLSSLGHSLSTAYDGFTTYIVSGTGTVTGTISVYGYKI